MIIITGIPNPIEVPRVILSLSASPPLEVLAEFDPVAVVVDPVAVVVVAVNGAVADTALAVLKDQEESLPKSLTMT